MSDQMVPIAVIYSRSEAAVIASMLEAAGMLVHIGGYNHASVQINPIALGGFRLTVPEFQHSDASRIIMENPGFGKVNFSYGLQRAVIKFLIFWLCIIALPISITAYLHEKGSLSDLVWASISVLVVPVNPQGNSEYYLFEVDEA